MDRGQEVRELKLGASFTNPNARTMYHTLKYDFKPASVDVHKEASLAVGSNNQVTVTVPHLDGSGVPNTIFKGNQREYARKECVLIFNRETNEITLERLNSNIQVKKTRTDTSNKPPPAVSGNNSANNISSSSTTSANSAGGGISGKVENQTARHSSKTRVSTGLRRNNILNFVPKHSPLQGSPSYPQHNPHRSPQQAPLWNANNTQQTLPSIPSLLDDAPFANNQPSAASSTMPKQQQQQQQQQQQPSAMIQQQQQQQQMAIEDEIGVLSSSESSSDSNDDDSDSDSDSADSAAVNHRMMNSNINNINNNNNTNMANNNSNHKKAPTSNQLSNHMDTAILRKDLCLSDSNSDSDF